MSNMRLGPWDLKRTLWDQMDAIRVQERKTWRFMLTEACRMFITSRGLVPDEGIIGENYAHASNVERLPNPAPVYTTPAVPAVGVQAAGVPAVGVPAVGVPAVELSPNAKRLINLKAGLARKRATLAAAYEELKTDPASLRANNLIKRLPDDIADSERLILEVGALVEAEEAALSCNSVDNSELGGDSI